MNRNERQKCIVHYFKNYYNFVFENRVYYITVLEQLLELYKKDEIDEFWSDKL